MKALTAAEMREVDRLTTARFGVPSLQLMENAGRHVAEAVLEEFAPEMPRQVAVLCGTGNNGGDGLVAARHLRLAGLDARVYILGAISKISGDAAENLKRWQEGDGKVVCLEGENAWEKECLAVGRSQVIVDALLGTGLRGAASALIARVIDDVNRHSRNATAPNPALIIAVDTPSGLPSDGQRAEGPVVYAHRTVTFTAPKVSQLLSRDADAVGALKVCDIGSPPALVEEIGQGTLRWAGPDEFAKLPLVRSVKSHKGTFGHVLLVAGSLGKSGAAILAGRGALRTGAGLVTIATPVVVSPTVASGRPEYMTEALASTEEGTIAFHSLESHSFQEILRGKTVLGIGPGLGTHPGTQEFIRNTVCGTSLPTVLDADGLNAFAGQGDVLRKRQSKFLVITPHPGEMARLLGSTSQAIQADRLALAQSTALKWNAHVVLKGYHSIVATPNEETFVSTAGNAGLGKGGTGDVLTGILSALIAQFGADDGARVLSLGVYLHGLAAEIASRGTDLSGLLASEVADAVPHARMKLIGELRKGG
jgi:ADP-dependent NAD(P)H-hydrate dehydratase / NAD(P)H-hydrate epimerase